MMLGMAVIAQRHRFVVVHHSHGNGMRGRFAAIAPSVRILPEMRRAWLAVLALIVIAGVTMTLGKILAALRLPAMHALLSIQIAWSPLAIVSPHVLCARFAQPPTG